MIKSVPTDFGRLFNLIMRNLECKFKTILVTYS